MQDQSRPARVVPEHIDLAVLVGRAPVAFDAQQLRQALSGRSVLITGAAGSIGQHLSELVLSMEPRSLVLLDHHEYSLFQLANKLHRPESTCSVTPFLVDVRNRRKIARIFQEHRPEIVFHLAAYKHVHLGEDNSDEVFDVNVLGTLNVVEEAISAGARRFVYPSTDKAVDPCNVYGSTKRLVELLLKGLGRQEKTTTFSIVRLVNTIGAHGGVIRVFAEQIERGQPITVTHQEMTRYWISMSEATHLLAFASSVDDVDGILVLDMGEPVRLLDVAQRLWDLLLGPQTPLRVTYVGLRAGERLHERVASDEEQIVPSRHPGIMVVRDGSPIPVDVSELIGRVSLMKEQMTAGDVDGLRRHIVELACR